MSTSTFLELTPLDESTLSPAVRKAASASAPAQLRMMAARGMAPLPPADLVVALYQIVVAEPPASAVRDAAEKTARELPDAVLHSALDAPHDPRVLHYFARMLAGRLAPLQSILGNPALDDETLILLARSGSDAVVEQIAHNEQRLLGCPAIISALYMNPRTRMSTAQRALELAIRNDIRVEGIPCFEDVKAAILSGEEADPSLDAAFLEVVVATGTIAGEVEPVDEQEKALVAEAADIAAGGEGELPPENPVQMNKLTMAAKLRLATLGNTFARAVLVRDKNRVIAMAAIRNPGTTEHEAERYAGNRSLHEDVIRYIAAQRQFTRRYSVKMNLVNNPKCPLQTAMGFLGHLTAKDLRMVSRSKGVSSALTKAAQGLVMKRTTH